MRRLSFVAIAATALFASSAARAAELDTWKFDFGGKAAPGFFVLPSDTPFREEVGFGFEGGSKVKAVDRGGKDPQRDGFLTSKGPFSFSVSVPEGIYRVRVVLGDSRDKSSVAIKAEARRLMLPNLETKPGNFETRSFLVAVKRPALRAGGEVRLKPDEQSGHRDWDNKLTIEFVGARPCVCTLEIEPAGAVPAIYIAGDSTVTDQRNEPYCGWGQLLPSFFENAVAVANHAQSGESLKSSLGARRFDKIFESIRPGDYLFIQFGHNDQKDKAAGAGPFTTYRDRLRTVVKRAREAKAQPVIVTSMERRHFEGDKIAPTLADYAEAGRQVAKEDNVPLIDLHAMSIRFYEAMGPTESTKAFVHFPANTYPDQTAPLKDDSHFNVYGAYQLTRCVAQGIRDANLDLAKFLPTDLKPYDPSKPDRPETVKIPQSALARAQKPEGN